MRVVAGAVVGLASDARERQLVDRVVLVGHVEHEGRVDRSGARRGQVCAGIA
jgi:hypothetical protein